MKISTWYYGFLILGLFTSCIGDDIIEDRIEPELRIMNKVASIEVGTEYQFEAIYFNNVGQAESTSIEWTTSDVNIISITPQGLATAISAGNVVLSALVNIDSGQSEVSFSVEAGSTTTSNEVTSRSGKIISTSSYLLQGDFVLETTSTGVILSISENYVTTTSLPGLYIYLGNNPNTISGALEIGKVEIFSGAHNYEINNVSINDFSHIIYFCKPFNVKVGEGTIEG